MTDSGANESKPGRDKRLLRALGWMLLGALGATVLIALFLAYAQPTLLLEQVNLRYCG
ncbi:MAG: hypothetical protein N2690_10875 [Rhodocyclaceae bacterium]|nr:hypothetical protein [Rhodocyclaceae bacterium]